jgi:integrase
MPHSEAWSAHGATMAKQAKTILRGALQLAVLANVIRTNPVRDVSPIKTNAKPKGAVALTADELRGLVAKVRASAYCKDHDLIDPITLLMATGLRRSELLALRWEDFDTDAGTLAVTGKVVRVSGGGLVRLDETKSGAGRRTIPLPKFAIEALEHRRSLPYVGQQAVIFPSTTGTLRDPNNFGKEWRKVREDLGVPEVTTHSFRKTVATLIDDQGLSARVGADHLGHTHVSMTQDRYMSRGRIHTQVAELLDRTIKTSNKRRLRGSTPKKYPLRWGGRGSNPRPTDYESAATRPRVFVGVRFLLYRSMIHPWPFAGVRG